MMAPMTLIACPECSQQVSTLAATCPHCGAPRRTTSSGRVGKYLALLGLGALIVIVLALIVVNPGSERHRTYDASNIPDDQLRAVMDSQGYSRSDQANFATG
jgi:hypothetical protein